MTSTKESTKGLDTSTQDNEVSWREKFKNGLKQGEVKWAIGAVVTLLWLRALLLWITGLNDFDIIYGYVVLSLLIIYLLAFLACVTSLFESCSFFIAYVIFAATIFLTISNQAMSSVILAVVTAPAMLLLRKVFSERNFGRKVLGNLLLSSSIIFVLWQIFMPDSDEKALNIKGLAHVFEVYYRNFTNIVCLKCDIFSNQSPLLELGNRVVFVIALGVFIYTALICTAIKSFLRWVLYFIAGFGALFTGVSYFHDSSITIQIASFCLFLVIFCSILPFIADDIEKEYPEVSEQLGLTRAYNRLYAWIRKSLKKDDQKAVLLMGRWGMGKTHCIRYLAHRLSMEHSEENEQNNKEDGEDSKKGNGRLNACNAFMGKAKICKVNLWEYSSREDAWNAIIQALGRTILGRYSLFHSVVLNKYLPSVIRSIFSGNIIGSLYELVFLSNRDRDRELCKQLSDKIGCNERIILILDDVERASFQIIKALPPLVEKLCKIERLMVICSLAKDELSMIHQKEINQGGSEEFALENLTGYLIKVFNYPFQIPELTPRMGKEFAKMLLREKDPSGECHLTRKYLDENDFHFATPRQIKRTIELLLGIERQFFYDCNDPKPLITTRRNPTIDYKRTTLYNDHRYIVFLVEIIGNFYPQVIREARIYLGGPVQYAYDLCEIMDVANKDIEKIDIKDRNRVEKFKRERKYIYKLLRTDYFVIELIKALKDCDKLEVQIAINGEYKRRRFSSPYEYTGSHENNKGEYQSNSHDVFQDFVGDKNNVTDGENLHRLEFFEYVMERIFDQKKDYAKILIRLIERGCFERDEPIFQESKVAFTWPMEDFMHLLYLYTEKALGNKNVKEAVLTMFERASITRKVNILREFYNGKGPLEMKDTISFIFYDHIENISSDKARGILSKLHELYLRSIISEIVCSKVTDNEILNHRYRVYHFYDLVKKGFPIEEPHISIPEGTRDEGLINLIDFVTLRSGFSDGYDGEQMATSKFKANMILPALKVWFDSHSVSSVISAKIDGLIEKCNDSIAYWKDDKTGLNTLRNYTVGAEKVKEFLEDLEAKKESHEENGTEKTSE